LGRELGARLTMLKLDNVSKVFTLGAFSGQTLRAVRNVSFEVKPGEVLSLIGESGSGKSTLGRMILKLTSISEGRISLDGDDITPLHGAALKGYYRKVQGVFQDPFSSYNPIFHVDHVFENIRKSYFPAMPISDWAGRVEASLRSVNLDPALTLGRYPHQMSGGQLQRVLVARALLLDLQILVADEIISMLDASTRIDVLNLLAELKTRGLGIVFVTHDLSLGNYISDKTVILRYGAVVEMGATEKVFGDPRHSYTKSLLAAVPLLHHRWEDEGFGSTSLVVEPPFSRGHAPTLVPVADDHLVAAE
jgi:ABC-type oligopeptide transport system ATPase subunit